jgi:hypothetical protein
MALAVRADEKGPFIGVEGLARRAAGNVRTESRLGFHRLDCLVAAGEEMVKRFIRVYLPVGGLLTNCKLILAKRRL